MTFNIPDDLPEAKKKVLGTLNTIMGALEFTDNNEFIRQIVLRGATDLSKTSMDVIIRRNIGTKENLDYLKLCMKGFKPDDARTISENLGMMIDFLNEQPALISPVFMVNPDDQQVFLFGLDVSTPQFTPVYGKIVEAERILKRTSDVPEFMRPVTDKLGVSKEKLEPHAYSKEFIRACEDLIKVTMWYAGIIKNVRVLFDEPDYTSLIEVSDKITPDFDNPIVGEKAVLLKGLEVLLEENKRADLLPPEFAENLMDFDISRGQVKDRAAKAAALAEKAARKAGKKEPVPPYIPQPYEPDGYAKKIVLLAIGGKQIGNPAAAALQAVEKGRAAIIANEINILRANLDMKKPGHKEFADAMFNNGVIANAVEAVGGIRNVMGRTPKDNGDKLALALEKAPELEDKLRNMGSAILLASATGDRDILDRAVTIQEGMANTKGAKALKALTARNNVTIGTALADIKGIGNLRA